MVAGDGSKEDDARMNDGVTTGQAEAANFIAAHTELTDFVRTCSDAHWAALVPIEERTVAVMADHMAAGYDLLAGWIETAQAGGPIPGTREQQDLDNALHAAQRGTVTREEVLARLEKSAPRVAAVLAMVPQDIADGDVHFGPAGGPMQVGRLMSMSALHVTRHLGHVREALASQS